MEALRFLRNLPKEFEIPLIISLVCLVIFAFVAVILLLIHLRLNVRPGRIKERLGKAWEKLGRYDLDRESWWVKFVKDTKIPGLKDAVRPDIHIVKRILWLLLTSTLFGFGLFWIGFLGSEIFMHPTTLTHHEEKVDITKVPFPTVTLGMSHNLKQNLEELLLRLNDDVTQSGFTVDMNGNQWNIEEIDILHTLVYQMCNPLPHELRWENEQDGDDIIGEQSPFDPKLLEKDFMKKSSELLKNFQPKCSEIMKICTWGGKKVNCSDAFSDTNNEVGAACGFNKIPEKALVIRKRPSIHARLINESFCPDDEKAWKKFNIDKDVFNGPEKGPGNCTKWNTQPSGGKQFGLSFIAEFDPNERKCLQFENGLAVVLDIHAIWDDSSTLRNGIVLPLNHDITIILEPMIIVSDEDIRPFDPKRRKCTFYNEAEQSFLDYYNFYSEQNCIRECVANEINKLGCGLISDPGKEGQTICSTDEELAEARKIQQTVVNCPLCLPACTEVKYRISEITKIPYNSATAPAAVKRSTNSSKSSIRVTIAFKESNAIVIRRKLTYDWSEVLGLIGGTLGLTNGLSFIDGGRFADALHGLFVRHGGTILATLSALFTALIGFFKCKRARQAAEVTAIHRDGDSDSVGSTNSNNSTHSDSGRGTGPNDQDESEQATLELDENLSIGSAEDLQLQENNADESNGARGNLWAKVRSLLPSISFLVHRAERRDEETGPDPEIGLRMRRGSRVRPATTPVPRTNSDSLGMQLPQYFSPPVGNRESRRQFSVLNPAIFLAESETPFGDAVDDDID